MHPRRKIKQSQSTSTFCSIFLCTGFVLICAITVGVIAGIGAIFQRVAPRTNDTISILPTPEHEQFLTEPTRNFMDIEPLMLNTNTQNCSLYEFANGNFGKFDRYDEMMRNVQTANDQHVALIESWIREGYVGNLSIAGGNGDGMVKFYRACEANRITELDSIIKAADSLITQMRQITQGPYAKLRFLIANGIVSHVQITKDRDNDGNFFHYIRPGGVLTYSDYQLDLAPLYGDSAPTSSLTKNMSVSMFLATAGSGWKLALDPDAQIYDTAIVENMDYFINLAKFIQDHQSKFESRLELFIAQALQLLADVSCIDKTFLTYIMSTCNLFRTSAIGVTDNYPDPLLDQISKDVLDIIKKMYFADADAHIRIQRCSSIFNSDNIGDIIQQKESMIEDIKDGESHVTWMLNATKYLASYYNPTYLFYSYPRVLDDPLNGEDIWAIDDPLRWWSQTNAWYDSFYDTVVIPIGFCRWVLYNPGMSLEKIAAQIVFIIAHEFVHSYQVYNLAAIQSCCMQYLSSGCASRQYEMAADIVGFAVAYEYYLSKAGAVVERDGIERFAIAFAQMFASLNPDVDPDGIHGSPRSRIDIPWIESGIKIFSSTNFLETCKPTPKCTVTAFHA